VTAEEFLSIQERLVDVVRDQIAEHSIDVVIAGYADLNGAFLGKRIPTRRFLQNPLASLAIPAAMWALDTFTGHPIASKPPKYDGWWPGFGTAINNFPDLESFRVVPWLDRTAVVLCEHFHSNGNPLEIAPRHVLRRVIERLPHRAQALFAAEFEFTIYRECEQSLHDKAFVSERLVPLSFMEAPLSVYRATADDEVMAAIIRAMESFGIPIQYWNPEAAAGQYEANIEHTSLPQAAERAFLFRHAVREIARQHGLTATFMAKPTVGYGSSCHLHQSLWAGGANLFWAEAGAESLTDLARHYIGGLVSTLSELTLVFAPTINSYKRLVPGSAAGTTATWGFDNRSAGLRVLAENAGGCRVENRVPGADANPYLAMAGSLSGGLWGIAEKIQTPDPFESNAYSDSHAKHLPGSLDEAVDAFSASAVAREYLGDEFVHFYMATRHWELQQARAAVTDWEVKRYF
jgi:glutamine synthetase